jgi:DNA-binding beta-propeller fold protein YncE
VTNERSNNLSKLDMNGNYLATFNVGLRPMGISVDDRGDDGSNNRIWLVNHYSNNLILLNRDGVIQKAIHVGTGPVSMGNMIYP